MTQFQISSLPVEDLPSTKFVGVVFLSSSSFYRLQAVVLRAFALVSEMLTKKFFVDKLSIKRSALSLFKRFFHLKVFEDKS